MLAFSLNLIPVLPCATYSDGITTKPLHLVFSSDNTKLPMLARGYIRETISLRISQQLAKLPWKSTTSCSLNCVSSKHSRSLSTNNSRQCCLCSLSPDIQNFFHKMLAMVFVKAQHPYLIR